MMEYLKNDIGTFIAAVHISDIHIRLLKRFDEYDEQFEKLYTAIDKMPKQTVICVVGDLLHNKADLSPESVQMASKFLKNLADKRPTVLIPGNHDAILANKSRLDSLSPIVNSINHPNLYYLKKSGLYMLGDILFNHMSLFDDPSSYLHAKDVPAVYRNKCNHLIGLYHGPVNGAITDIGFQAIDKTMNNQFFDGHDMVFLGDIHRHQTLQQYDFNANRPIIVYPGSLLQQDHGESVENHGYVVWNLKTRRFVHVDLLNDYGYFTIDIEKGKLLTDVTNIPKMVRLRVRCKESGPTEVKAIIAQLKTKTSVLEAIYIRSDSEQNETSTIKSEELNLNEIYSHEYQNKLIENFLKKKYSEQEITPELLTKIFEINKELNQKLNKETSLSSRNVRWIPKKFEFDNMFSYGEDNVIDFSKIKGINGLFASNASGKSSIFSALTFCLFDKCERTFKASYILNSQKMSFKCKFNFEISGVDYFIERKGTADKKGNVKVDVSFWKEVNGKITELHGEARRSTNDIIRDYIGTYEDFLLTTLSVQTNNNKSASAFVDMGQTERKDLLSQFMGLNVFDDLYKFSTDKLKHINSVLEEYNTNETNSDEVITEFDAKISGLESTLKEENEKLEKSSLRRDEINSKIIEENKKMIKLDKRLPNNISLIERSIEKYNKNITDDKSELETLKTDVSIKKSELSVLESLCDKYVSEDITSKMEKFDSITKKINEQNNLIEKTKIIVANKHQKLKHLEKHEYDPNCKYCMNNVFVKDAQETKKSIESDEVYLKELMDQLHSSEEELLLLENVNKKYELYVDATEKKNDLILTVRKMENDILKLENSIVVNTNELVEAEEDRRLYYEQKDNIEKNNSIDIEIDGLTTELKNIGKLISDVHKSILSITTNLITVKRDSEQYKNNIAKIKEYESMQKAYEFYTTSVSRDGIPFELISRAVPVVEKEVNEILHQLTDFTISIQTDGKNVMTYIVYDNKSWPLEMSSGMEKFISSIAIRVALVNVSNLPKTNCFIIDEGWGTLDADNLSGVRLLFDYLKNKFDFMLIISHLDVMKDTVDGALDITKVNGFSHIEYK